ncbi:MAG TPA: sulfurtransferase [Candidatus Acidoferrales bacterium]|nr:sulfurtransferase [Candidatus Acidoferrales bacterium]
MTLPLFVESEWLVAHIDDPRIRIVDARSVAHGVPAHVDVGPSGLQRYRAGHIAGAVHVDYMDDLSDPSTPYAARVAPPEHFARAMSERGIGDDTVVVAYDDGDTPFAARIVWMLRYYGHDDAHILAGGLRDWKAAGLPLTTDLPVPRTASFGPRPRPALRAARDEVLAVAEGRSDAQLLETQRDKTYAFRDRDIRGAKRLSASALFEDANGGRPAPPGEIDRMVRDLGLDRTKRTVVSCGSGVGASAAYLALTERGFKDVAVYDGSWMEWSHLGLPTVGKL